MADDFDIDDNPEWTDENSRPADDAAKLQSARAALLASQADFAALLGIPVATLQNWEQRRTEPDPIARTLIDLVFDDPEGMRERLLKRKAAA
jgi:putative transcriptional regulator